MMMPDAIAATIRRSLYASASVAAYLAISPSVPPATRDAAQRDLADVEKALAWLNEQQVARVDELIALGQA